MFCFNPFVIQEPPLFLSDLRAPENFNGACSQGPLLSEYSAGVGH